MRKKYIYYILLIVGIVLIVYFVKREDKDKIQAPIAREGNLLEVRGIVASGEDFANVITVSGSIEANEQVQIRSEVSGLVKTLSFHEGSKIKKGQLLLQIDD